MGGELLHALPPQSETGLPLADAAAGRASTATTLASSLAAALDEAGGESIQVKVKSAEWRLTTRGRAT